VKNKSQDTFFQRLLFLCVKQTESRFQKQFRVTRKCF